MSELTVRCRGPSKMCRLCLAADTTIFIDIFSFCNEINSKIHEAIMKCAPVQIDIQDKLPNGICNLCFRKLVDFNEFQKRIISSEKTLILNLQKLENCDYRNNDILKLPQDIKTEPMYTIVKCEDDSVDQLEQLEYNLGDSKTHLYDPMPVQDVKASIFTNFCAFDAERDCQPNENFDFCTTNTVEQSGTDTKNSIIEYSDENGIDISETKVCLRNTLDEDFKKPELTDPVYNRQNVSVDYVNKFCLSDGKINENVDTPVEYTSQRNNISKKRKVKRNRGIKTQYQCNMCDKSFSFLSVFTIHKRSHTGEKPYKCDICDRSFAQSSCLFSHKRSHTGEKQYKCDFCDKSFVHSCYLLTHKRSHTGEKPYKCDVCDKSFSQLSNLNTHKRSHTGEKPYKCDLCDKSFSRCPDLNRHKRTGTHRRKI